MTPTCSLPQLLVFLPYHLGFHVTQSLVVVGLRGGCLDLVERADLDDGQPLLSSTIHLLRVGLRQRESEEILVIAFRDGLDADPALHQLTASLSAIAPMRAVMEVSRGRWRYWYPAHDERRSVTDWLDLPHPADVPAVTDYMGRGVAPFADRAALAEALAGPRSPDGERIARLVEVSPTPSPAVGMAAWSRLLSDTDLRWERTSTPRLRAVADPGQETGENAIAANTATTASTANTANTATDSGGDVEADAGADRLPHPGVSRGLDRARTDRARTDRPRADRPAPGGAHVPLTPGERDAVTALSFVTRVAHRDQVLMDLVPVMSGPGGPRLRAEGLDERLHIRDTLIRLVQVAPDDLRVTLLAILAVWAWDAGDGALASIAADLALDVDPDHVLANLVSTLLHRAVWPRVG